MQNIHEPDDDEVDDDNPPSKSSKKPRRNVIHCEIKFYTYVAFPHLSKRRMNDNQTKSTRKRKSNLDIYM